MKVHVVCPSCRGKNEIPEIGKEFTIEGSTGSRPCILCGAYIQWKGEDLVVEEQEMK